MAIESYCLEVCPYKDEPNAAKLRERCNELRIRLDFYDPVTDEAGTIVGEVGKFACGSAIGPDINLPSMPFSDYKNTELKMPQLKRLYDKGLLPEQQT